MHAYLNIYIYIYISLKIPCWPNCLQVRGIVRRPRPHYISFTRPKAVGEGRSMSCPVLGHRSGWRHRRFSCPPHPFGVSGPFLLKLLAQNTILTSQAFHFTNLRQKPRGRGSHGAQKPAPASSPPRQGAAQQKHFQSFFSISQKRIRGPKECMSEIGKITFCPPKWKWTRPTTSWHLKKGFTLNVVHHADKLSVVYEKRNEEKRIIPQRTF